MAASFKVLVFTPIWGRHKVVKIWKEGIDRINAYWPDMFEFIPFAVCSTKEDVLFIESIGVNYTISDNDQLGKKHNEGLEATKNIEYDYIVQLGSDDVITNYYLHYAAHAMQNDYDVFGVDNLLFWSIAKKEGKLFNISNGKNKVVGAGRFISKQAITECKFKLWIDDLQKGLDYVSQCKLETKGYDTHIIRTDETPVIDFKTEVNIWKYDNFSGQKTNKQYLTTLIGKKELDAIASAEN